MQQVFLGWFWSIKLLSWNVEGSHPGWLSLWCCSIVCEACWHRLIMALTGFKSVDSLGWQQGDQLFSLQCQQHLLHGTEFTGDKHFETLLILWSRQKWCFRFWITNLSGVCGIARNTSSTYRHTCSSRNADLPFPSFHFHHLHLLFSINICIPIINSLCLPAPLLIAVLALVCPPPTSSTPVCLSGWCFLFIIYEKRLDCVAVGCV